MFDEARLGPATPPVPEFVEEELPLRGGSGA